MLQAAAQSDGLAAVVFDGAGSLAEDLDNIPSPGKWIGFPFLAAKTGAVALFSNTAPPPELTELVPRIAQRMRRVSVGRLSVGGSPLPGVPGERDRYLPTRRAEVQRLGECLPLRGSRDQRGQRGATCHRAC